MKLTPFGKLVRQHRLELELTLNEMASKLGASAAFVSAVETGVKKIPADYPAKVATALDLNKEEAAELTRAAELSVDEIKVSIGRGTSRHDREVVALFARRFNTLPAGKKQNIRQLLED